MHRRADPRRRHIDLSRIGLGVIDELLHRVRWYVGIDFHHIGHADEARDRRHVGDEIERKILIQAGIDGVGGVDQENCGAVGRRVHRHLGGEIISGAGLVLDRELLMQMLGQILPDQARANIGRPARRITDQPAYRVIGIVILGARHAGGGCGRRAGKAEHGKCRHSPAQNAHPALLVPIVFLVGREPTRHWRSRTSDGRGPAIAQLFLVRPKRGR